MSCSDIAMKTKKALCWCGKEFDSYVIRDRRYRGQWTQSCSIRCASEVQRGSPISVQAQKCVVCGKFYYLQAGTYQRKRCRACYPRWRKVSHTMRYSAEAYAVMKKKVRQATGCAKCGSREHLQAHHVIGIKEAPLFAADPNNITAICRPCHLEEHGRKSHA